MPQNKLKTGKPPDGLSAKPGELTFFFVAGFRSADLADLIDQGEPRLIVNADVGDDNVSPVLKCTSMRDAKVAGISVALDTAPGMLGVILYQTPLDHAASAITGQADVSVALDNWVAQSAELLKTCHQYRGRLLLADGRAVVSDLPGLVTALERQFGLKLNIPQVAPGMTNPSGESRELAYFLATCYLDQHADAKTIAGELEARSQQVFPERNYSSDSAIREYKVLSGAVASLEKNRKRLEERLRLAQEQYEIHYFRAQKLSRLIDAERQDDPNFQPGNFIDEQGFLEDARTEEEILRQALREVYSSWSWRVTAPLRGCLDIYYRFRKKL